MSKRPTQLELALAAQVCENEVKKLAKILATGVLGIHPAEWAELTKRFSSTNKRRCRNYPQAE